MTDSFLKLRGRGSFGRRYATKHGKGPGAKTKAGGKRNRFPDGQFESWWPTKVGIWINISPFQEFTQEVYDRDSKEVVEVTTTWWEYNSHWIPARKRKFVCSSGAHRTNPCYGEAIRQSHWDMLDKTQKEKGFRPDKAPPVGRALNFALGITIMEEIYSIPLTNKDGSFRKSKNGTTIHKHLAAPLVEIDKDEIDGDEGVSTPTKFGHRAHWSLGSTHLDQLTEWDEELRSRCGHCAGHLLATHVVCPDCETQKKFPKPVGGEDLLQARNRAHKCKACGYKGAMVPIYACPDCGDAKEGGLTQFDLRIKKVMTGEKSSVLKLIEIRVPTDDEETQKLIQNPLKVDEIFRPAPLDWQKRLLGDLADGVDPSHGSFSEDYTNSDEDGVSY